MRLLKIIAFELASLKLFQLFVPVQNIQLCKHQHILKYIFYINVIIKLNLDTVEVTKSKTSKEIRHIKGKKVNFIVKIK